MKAWAFADVLVAIGTAGAGSAITSAARTARSAGVTAAMASMRAAMRQSAKNMAQNLGQKAWVRRQLRGQAQSVKDNILENGAILFLTQSLPGSWGEAFLTVASIVDPSGITGVVSEFMPKESCDESSFFNDPLPETDESEPELAVLDECRVGGDRCGGSLDWEGEEGFCRGYKGYNMCRFGQEQGWHRHNIATFSAGVGTSRARCLEDAQNSGAVGSISMLRWGWHFCYMIFANTTCDEAGVSDRPGYYMETIGRRRRRDGPLHFGGNTSRSYFCHKRR